MFSALLSKALDANIGMISAFADEDLPSSSTGAIESVSPDKDP